MKIRVTIIGAGNMGQAMAKALVRDGHWAVTVVDRPDKKIKPIYGTRQTKTLAVGLSKAQIVLLAVKPQDGKEALRGMRGLIPSQAVLVSIMVGATLKGLQRASGHSKVVRAMPNMPAQIGMGMTVWCATKKITTTQKKLVQQVFETFGQALPVTRENLVDVATAISGSGPAYVFALGEYMTAAAVRLGLTQEAARQMVTQTLVGASQLLKQTAENPVELRQKVMSKKGTTEAAFQVFEHRHTKQIYLTALTAAFARTKKVSRGWK